MVRRLTFRDARERTGRALTQNQLQELLESDQIRAIVEGAEERGFIDPAAIVAFAAEQELNEQEVEELTRELERTGLEIGQPAAAAPVAAEVTDEAEDEKEKEKEEAPTSDRRDLRLRRQPAALPRRRRHATSCSPPPTR